ncbi:MAG: flagellar biosynthetic protein FliR [Phycisphaerales bacterium]|nr:flagellar biosynthetic protein FliR [Phycisphaerales bacterium]
MTPLDGLYQHIGPFLMVLARLGGLFLFAPILSSASVPYKARVMLAIILSLAVYPAIPASQQVPIALDLYSLAPAMFFEVLIGLAIGLVASLPMYGVQLGGLIIGQQLGFGLAGIYNPALDTESDVVGELLLNIALAIFIGIGGLENVFLALAATFTQIPLAGAGPGSAPLELTVGLVSSGFELALRIAAPVLCILLVETLATGFIMKTIPQINIMSIGFAVKIIAGFGALIGALYAMQEVIGDEVLRAGQLLLQWTSG